MIYSEAHAGPSTTHYKFPNNPPQHPQTQHRLSVLPVPHDQNYRRPAPISLTDDLLSRFGLYDAFQRQVVGHYKAQQNAALSQPGPSSSAASSSLPASNGLVLDGGLGKASAGQPAPNAEDAVGAAKKEKKREKDLYKTLFKDLPGKHDTKRDRYLSELLNQPLKEGKIMLLDDVMAEMAFTIFDVPQPLNEDEENKKRKKKRKREQEQGPLSVAATPAHLPTPGGPLPSKQAINAPIKQEIDPQRPAKRPRQDTYPMPLQQPTPSG